VDQENGLSSLALFLGLTTELSEGGSRMIHQKESKLEL